MIDTIEKLAEFLPKLRAADWVALDTEADSLHAYPEKVCLIQISIAGSDWLVDPLAGLDLNPLLDAEKRAQGDQGQVPHLWHGDVQDFGRQSRARHPCAIRPPCDWLNYVFISACVCHPHTVFAL